eukprot:CAMPEP_0172047938 /NCGR_PEP_ID=MMETSP1043-20130122/1267_1 /TAXON_ID=464988 /ORGANISM="Hemiselmis andersenii, Strain CCMP441" /LENGTH=213 /DNA_ID=CAMNT_0012706809 /DNA_START=309 /DNA_END=946 /DNA_ORIENTATION=-
MEQQERGICETFKTVAWIACCTRGLREGKEQRDGGGDLLRGGDGKAGCILDPEPPQRFCAALTTEEEKALSPHDEAAAGLGGEDDDASWEPPAIGNFIHSLTPAPRGAISYPASHLTPHLPPVVLDRPLGGEGWRVGPVALICEGQSKTDASVRMATMLTTRPGRVVPETIRRVMERENRGRERRQRGTEMMEMLDVKGSVSPGHGLMPEAPS